MFGNVNMAAVILKCSVVSSKYYEALCLKTYIYFTEDYEKSLSARLFCFLSQFSSASRTEDYTKQKRNNNNFDNIYIHNAGHTIG